MEQDIKNFDRTIEQMMNEQQVAPPFGMWNRISAELETMPVAATTPPTTVVPKRAIVGIIAAALMVGAAFTGYMVNSFVKNNNSIGGSIVTPHPATIQTPVLNPVKVAIQEPQKNEPVAAVITKKHEHTSPLIAVKPEETKGAEEVAAVTVEPALPVNGNMDVPTPIQPISASLNGENPTYYFPPVDMNIPEKGNKEKAGSPVAKSDDEDDDSDKKSLLNSQSEKKLKYHPPHRKRFHYPTIIRSK